MAEIKVTVGLGQNNVLVEARLMKVSVQAQLYKGTNYSENNAFDKSGCSEVSTIFLRIEV